ncbi:MAG: hypothetical protein AB1578_20575 [Thermodesulfobacteriota bacterium]
MVRTVIGLDPEDKQWLDDKAREERVPMAEIVRRAVRRLRSESEIDLAVCAPTDRGPTREGFPCGNPESSIRNRELGTGNLAPGTRNAALDPRPPTAFPPNREPGAGNRECRAPFPKVLERKG